MQSSKCITNKQLKNGSHSDSPSLSHFCPLPLCLHLSRMTCVVGSRGGVSPAATASSRRMRDDGARWCHGGSVPPFIFLSSNTQRMAATATQSSSPQCRLRPRLRCVTIHTTIDHDLQYTGGVLLLCGWGLWPAAGVRCCTCLPLLHARLHLSMMHLLLGDWAPPSWPWPRSSGCK